MGLLILGLMALMVISMIGLIVFIFARGFGQWSANNRQPVLTAPARVVAKRTHASGHNHVSTSYYVTFELPAGERREFAVGGAEYGMLAEHDAGLLAFQGTRYKGFQRGPA